jgi:hypothetical protein
MEGQRDGYARVGVEDAKGQRARACPHHAVAVLEGLAGARVIWDDTHGNDYEVTALRIAEKGSQLSRKGAVA